MEESGSRRKSAIPYQALGRVGFILSLVVGAGLPILLVGLVAAGSPFAGAAIDPYDNYVLEPAERAVLNGIADAIGTVLLTGTVLGIAAMTIGIWTRRKSKLGTATLVLAGVAPLICLLISFWMLAAAGSPDHISG